MVVVEIEFDERDPLYKCCCGIFHVRTGTRILSVINVIMAAFLAFQLFFIPYNLVWSILEYSSATANVISSSLMFIATFTFRPRLVIAHLVFQHLFQMSFLEEQLSGLDEGSAEAEIIIICFYFASFLFVMFMWEVFLLRVSFQCYNYLLEVRDAREGVSRLPPLRLETNTKGVFLVGMENVGAFYSNFG